LPFDYNVFRLVDEYLFLQLTIHEVGTFHIKVKMSQLLCVTKAISDLIVFHFTIGAKVSLKSTPSLYSNPHANNLTLSFSSLTSRLGFTLYTQHVVIGFFHYGKSTSLQV